MHVQSAHTTTCVLAGVGRTGHETVAVSSHTGINTRTKMNLRKKGFVWLVAINHHKGKPRQGLKQGRDLEGGAEAETVEECCSLACFPLLSQRPVFVQPRAICLGITLPIVAWDFLHQITIEKIASATCQ